MQQIDCGFRYFSYFTNLSLIGVTAYLIAAGVQTVWYALRDEKSFPLVASWPRPFLILHNVLLSTASAICFFCECDANVNQSDCHIPWVFLYAVRL